MIVGGNSGSGSLSSVEEYDTNTNQSSKVGDLPQGRSYGSLCNNVYCGGNGGDRSCVKLEGENFSQMPVTMVQSRYGHLCWGLPSGEILLMGGQDSSLSKTTEKLSSDGTSSSPDFNLAYQT